MVLRLWLLQTGWRHVVLRHVRRVAVLCALPLAGAVGGCGKLIVGDRPRSCQLPAVNRPKCPSAALRSAVPRWDQSTCPERPPSTGADIAVPQITLRLHILRHDVLHHDALRHPALHHLALHQVHDLEWQDEMTTRLQSLPRTTNSLPSLFFSKLALRIGVA